MRIHALDNAKFLMVGLVVFGHFIEPLIDNSPILKSVYLSIYSFHMPVFALLSGMTSNSIASVSCYRKTARTILIPLLLFTVLYEVFHFFIAGSVSSYARNLQPYWILWFLYSLFLWRLLLPFMLKTRFPILLSCCCAVGAGYIDSLGYFLGISRTIYFFPFFLLGYRLAPTFFERPIVKNTPKGLLGCIVLLNLMVFWWASDLSPQWLWGSSSYANMGMHDYWAGAVRSGLYVISFITSIGVLMLMPHTAQLFTRFGQGSLSIYLWHGFIVKALIAVGVLAWIGTISLYIQLFSLAMLALVVAAGLGSRPVVGFTDRLLLKPVRNQSNRTH